MCNEDRTWGVTDWSLAFGGPVERYRVQPAPPQPKFRPMNHDELMELVIKGVVARASSRSSGKKCIGALQWASDVGFHVSDMMVDTSTLLYADTRQPVQVEING